MQKQRLSLRDRRRLQTYRELHRVAVTTSFEDGLKAATIDVITQGVGVSRRTFFNYYASKEDALLGITAPLVSQQAAAQYLDDSATDEFTRTIRLVVAVIQSGLVEGEGLDQTQKILRRFPELRGRFVHHFAAVEEVVAEFLDEHPRAAHDQPSRSKDSTRAIVAMASTVLRQAYRSFHAPHHDTLDKTIESAISTFRTALKDIL